MDKAVQEYRLKHRKCAYCAHGRGLMLGMPAREIWWCKAKLKSLSARAAFAPRPNCKCFMLKEGK